MQCTTQTWTAHTRLHFSGGNIILGMDGCQRYNSCEEGGPLAGVGCKSESDIHVWANEISINALTT